MSSEVQLGGRTVIETVLAAVNSIILLSVPLDGIDQFTSDVGDLISWLTLGSNDQEIAVNDVPPAMLVTMARQSPCMATVESLGFME